MLEIIEAPCQERQHGLKIFIAGGISDCGDWQKEYIDTIREYWAQGAWDAKAEVTFFNPRRHNFDVTNKDMEKEQIQWEYDKLHTADIITFWFPPETLCPITLYELGYWTNQMRAKLIVGCDPEYQRRNDVIIQTGLAETLDYPVFNKLDDVIWTTVQEIKNRLN